MWDIGNKLFLKSHAMKFMDLVKFKTAIIMFKARHNSVPGNIQKMFCDREGGYNLRGKFNFKKHCVRTKKKSMCISVCGVDLWNGLGDGLKRSTNINHFKKLYKKDIFGRYMVEEEL